ncbi:HNH endonuclease [Colwellia sp. MSW7]|uniref:HNH endonuclease n=1 Tax=Colwellia maritima TaxID=2912588 RepID=A0ABS9WZ98_9GAMM|nr:HNH endonuclease [Colwellia maritima]
MPTERNSVHYDLVLNGKRYPPKYVVSLATLFATGDEYPAADFNAVEAKNFFQARDYEVIDRRGEAEHEIVSEDDESDFPEGSAKFKQHRYLERDSKITKKAKAKRLADTGKLECDVCTLDFEQQYGERGHGFIEGHHTKPVSMLDGKEKTKVSDIALVCSNCHRMLHRGTKLLSVAQLKKIFYECTIT